MMLSERLNKLPECQHRTENFCGWLSQRFGRLYSVTPLLCNFTCARHGPYCGRQPENETGFIRQMWKRNSPLGDGNLARRVMRNYSRPVNVHVPEIWPKIRECLNWLESISGFRGLMLTGSVILRRAESMKDLDIVIRCDNVQTAITIKECLPSRIEGIKTDFYFYVGDNPDVYFACLDCDAKKLYVSRWLPLTIASVEAGIEVVMQPENGFGRLVVETLAKPEGVTEEARQGWNGVFREWERLTSFVAAARSRGILATAKQVAGIDNGDGFHCDDSTLQRRKASCFGNAKSLPCPVLVENGAGHKFCGACGCGQTQIARLDADTPDGYSKLHYPTLRCPLNRDGFTQ